MIMQPKVLESKIKQRIYIPQVNLSVGQLVINTNLLLLLEMQRYIDMSSYRDTLGSDTVSIHI